jgi:hypothetical protein
VYVRFRDKCGLNQAFCSQEFGLLRDLLQKGKVFQSGLPDVTHIFKPKIPIWGVLQ